MLIKFSLILSIIKLFFIKEFTLSHGKFTNQMIMQYYCDYIKHIDNLCKLRNQRVNKMCYKKN